MLRLARFNTSVRARIVALIATKADKLLRVGRVHSNMEKPKRGDTRR
jgi:hypothetical protein